MKTRRYKKYRKKCKKMTLIDFFNKFQRFCVCYVIIYIVTLILGMLSKLNDNSFFRWCGIISMFLSFPMSRSDLLITILGLHWFIFGLGIIIIIVKIVRYYNDYLKNAL